MPNVRLTMRKIREILRLSWDCKLSNHQIARSCSISRGTVESYIHRAKAAGLSWPLPDDLDEANLEKLLFPKIAITPQDRPEPDFSAIGLRLKRKGVTLGLEWERYKQEYPERGYSYPQFCALHRQWNKTVNVVMRQHHNAGHKASPAKHYPSPISILVKYIRPIYLFVLLALAITHTLNSFIHKMPKLGALDMLMPFTSLMAAQK
jgi:hypothetical protein